MKKIGFNDSWKVSKNLGFMSMTGDSSKIKVPEVYDVHLPHDAMILKKRDADVPGGWGVGYYPTDTQKYTKEFEAPLDWEGKKVLIEFEGVYCNAVVTLNGNYIGKRPFGYGNFYLDLTKFLKLGRKNKLCVTVKNRMGFNGRWYTGEGIYRKVNLYVSDPLRILPEGVQIATPAVGTDVTDVVISTKVKSERLEYRKIRVKTTITDAQGNVVGENSSPARIECGETLTLRHHIFLYDCKLWSLEEPNLYFCKTELFDGDELVDEVEDHFGIREIRLDPKYGLRLNGKPIEIHGGCFHHDNGVIGACAFDRAEERKVELFKKAGYNAMRSAHNPASKALLDAADRLGMLIMDESFDMWNKDMMENDYSLFFEEWWQKDLEAMIEKDFNHPSVVMYSIGNEIPERDGTSDGGKWSRKQAEFVRAMDSTRIVASGICGITSEGGDVGAMMLSMLTGDTTGMADVMANISNSDFLSLSEDYAASLDLVGMNYLHTRYAEDVSRKPNRMICGTESGAMNIASIYKEVRKTNNVLGDFTWTGMDYIGECGCGKIDYDNIPALMFGCYPWILAYCGDIDLIGTRRPQSYFREIVWGKRSKPYIAVGRPERIGQTPVLTDWSWPDVISSWSFPGFEGKDLQVSVYSDAPEVALYVNGVLVGKAAAGVDVDYAATFTVPYTPGEIKAVAIRNGMEAETEVLATCGTPVAISVQADRDVIQAGAEDLAYLDITFVDDAGRFVPYANRKVTVKVEGAGTLQGCGSGDPTTGEDYFDENTTTFDGRMLAVIRSAEQAGTIKVTVSSEGFEDAMVEIIGQL